MQPPLIKNENVQRVTCNNCRHALTPADNTNYCQALGRRVCSCSKHGRACKQYEEKKK